MRIDIVIPCYTKSPYWLRLLQSLCSLDLNYLGKVVLVFNPKVPPEETKTTWPFLLERVWLARKGVNRARNLGASLCQAEYVLFLDADCWLTDTNILSHIVSKLQENKDVDILGGNYIHKSQRTNLAAIYHLLQQDWLYRGQKVNGTNAHLLGGCMVVRRKIFSRYRFAEEITFGAAETSLLQPLSKDGYQLVYDAHLSVAHDSNLSWRQFFYKAYWQGFHSARFLLEPSVQLKSLDTIAHNASFFVLQEKMQKTKLIRFTVFSYRTIFHLGWILGQTPSLKGSVKNYLRALRWRTFCKTNYIYKSLQNARAQISAIQPQPEINILKFR